MAKKSEPIQEPRKNIKVVTMATQLKLPMLSLEGEKTLMDGLAKLGARFEITSFRSNDVDGGKSVWGRKVKVTSFTFLTDTIN